MFVTKTRTLATLVLAVCLGGAYACNLGAAEAPAKKTDAENIQGTWIAISVEVAGKARPPAVIKDFTVVITADKVVFNPNRDRTCTYKLDPSKKPKVIVLTPLDGPVKGQPQKAIYELDGDNLKLCAQNGKGEPPTEFATKAKSDLRLLILKRAKK